MSRTIKLGLLGNNLGRSRAKNLHELLGEIHGLNITYSPMDLLARPTPVSISGELERCRAEGFLGVNVTHPFKREAFDFVVALPGFPRGLTSVNTVLFAPEGMMADNTDYTGCCRAFLSQFGAGFKPGRTLMLGAGGVGVAIAYALLKLGAEELVVFDTNAQLAESLIRQMSVAGMRIRLAGPDLAEEMRLAQGLVNATPIGMFQYPGNPFPPAGFGTQQWAFDAVYTPENTEFLQECRRRKIDTLSGFYLFLYQGLDAFVRFTGIVAEADATEREFLKRFPLE